LPEENMELVKGLLNSIGDKAAKKRIRRIIDEELNLLGQHYITHGSVLFKIAKNKFDAFLFNLNNIILREQLSEFFAVIDDSSVIDEEETPLVEKLSLNEAAARTVSAKSFAHKVDSGIGAVDSYIGLPIFKSVKARKSYPGLNKSDVQSMKQAGLGEIISPFKHILENVEGFAARLVETIREAKEDRKLIWDAETLIKIALEYVIDYAESKDIPGYDDFYSYKFLLDRDCLNYFFYRLKMPKQTTYAGRLAKIHDFVEATLSSSKKAHLKFGRIVDVGIAADNPDPNSAAITTRELAKRLSGGFGGIKLFGVDIIMGTLQRSLKEEKAGQRQGAPSFAQKNLTYVQGDILKLSQLNLGKDQPTIVLACNIMLHLNDQATADAHQQIAQVINRSKIKGLAIIGHDEVGYNLYHSLDGKTLIKLHEVSGPLTTDQMTGAAKSAKKLKTPIV